MKCKLCNRTDIKSKKLQLCSIHYARWYRKNNKEKIKPVARAKYLRKKDYYKNKSQTWKKENRDRYNEATKKLYRKDSKEWNIRESTRYYYGDLKKESSCEMCGSEDRLEFHHERPYNIHNFVILCFKCHRNLHGQLFTEKQANRFISLVEENKKRRVI